MLIGRKSKGFTLVEIMIAMAIFAIVSTTVLKNATQSISQTRMIKERTIAQWIAENQLQELRMLPRGDEHFPSVGIDRSSVTMANREWQVEMDVSNTGNELMRRIEVVVFDDADLDVPLAQLTGFLGRY
ncbi:MAG TPA: type II secretion system protein GspI [Gammaproteobacteria bacterium]|nr:type II secretion system protein GspI [Gammaproteobacteria bacterium]|tara:strand:+ start:2161 stop:2547 length:387 start_codon:yes stop_codon:yes gene_type:complete